MGTAAMSTMRLPAMLSIVGHLAVLALLLIFAGETHPPPEPLEKRGMEVMLSPALAEPQATPAPAPPIRPVMPPTAAAVPTEETVAPLPATEAPAAPIAEIPVAPPDQTITAAAPSPPRKPVARQQPQHVVRRPEPPRDAEPAPAPPTAFAAQYAAVRSPAASLPGPDPAMNYRALISAWFETHKRYPDSARERGEEGSVALSFRVDRFGRVIDYSLLTSSGYADLDQSVDQMMRGAQLPPFPAAMTQPEIEVSVRIAFSLTR
jgi:protein TonB